MPQQTGTDTDDFLDGTSGVDTMTGGKGNDSYRFEWNFGGNGTLDNGDRIADYESGETIVIFRSESKPNATTVFDQANNRTELRLDMDLDGTTDRTIYLDGNKTGDISIDHNCCGSPTAEIKITGKRIVGTDRGEVLTGLDTDLADTIFAGGGADTVNAGAGDDIAFGGSGADTMFGQGGDDQLWAGEGDDESYGGGGNDVLGGREGRDALYGGVGADTLYGGADADSVYGGLGDDLSFGGAGNDVVDSGSGNDVAYGGAGADTVIGGAGNDVLGGGDGADSLRGSSGNDTMYGGAGNDTMQGGDGSDHLFGGPGDDLIDMGANDGDGDYYISTANSGNDTVTGFENGIDKLMLGASGITSFADVQARLGQDASGNATIDLGNGSSLTLDGVSQANIDASDFMF